MNLFTTDRRTEDNPRIQPMGNNIEWHVWHDDKGGMFYKEVNTKSKVVGPTKHISLLTHTDTKSKNKGKR